MNKISNTDVAIDAKIETPTNQTNIDAKALYDAKLAELKKIEIDNNVPFSDNSMHTNVENVPNAYNKDKILGHVLASIRHSKDGLLFAMFNNIKSYDIIDNNLVVTCDKLVNWQDLTMPKIVDTINNYLHSFDSNLNFQVQLEEDKSDELREENLRKLKETFGNLLTIKQ